MINKNDFEKITKSLLSTFILSGRKSLELRKNGLITKIKPDNTPVTNGDLEVNKILCSKISSLTPDVPIISEETVDINSKNNYKNFWLVDPIDGTNDYINNKDEFTINAALIINLEPAIGIIYAPAKKRLFYSYGMDKSFEESNNKIINLSKIKKIKKKIIALTNSKKPSDNILQIHKVHNVSKTINMRSSYKFCVIATGEYDLYVANARACEWDIAAGHAIVIHAGGIVTDQNGNSFKYGKKDYKNTSLLVKK